MLREFCSALAIVLCSLAPAVAHQPGQKATFTGNAHWYGGHFHGRRTASGAVFNKNDLTCAHPSLPFGTRLKVKSVYTGKECVVKVTDRCPYLKVRCIDLSEGAARKIGIYPTAPSKVTCVVLGNHDVPAVEQTDSSETK